MMTDWFIIVLLVVIVILSFYPKRKCHSCSEVIYLERFDRDSFTIEEKERLAKEYKDPNIPHLQEVGGMKVQIGEPDPKEASKILSRIDDINKKFIKYMVNHYPDDPAIKQLNRNYNSDDIFEGSPYNDDSLTSYTTNKKILGLCLRQPDQSSELIKNVNLLTFVSLHELSHMANKSIGHDAQFWSTFKWFLTEATKIGLYTPVDYSKSPKRYCGITVKSNPLFE